MPPAPPSEPPGPGKVGANPGSHSALCPQFRRAFTKPSSLQRPKTPRAEERESALSRLATSPSGLPLTPRSPGKRSQWPRDHPRSFPHRHPRSVADTARRPQHPTPAHHTSSGSGGAGHRNSWVPDSGSPRPPLRLNSACFSTKWRRRSRAHVAAFPLPVPISSFAARPRRDGPSTSQ